MTYLLDTNVVSDLGRRRPDRGVLAWFTTVSEADLYVSVLTVGQIRQGIESLRARDRSRVAALAVWLDGLLTEYGSRIIPIDTAVADRWGQLDDLSGTELTRLAQRGDDRPRLEGELRIELAVDRLARQRELHAPGRLVVKRVASSERTRSVTA